MLLISGVITIILSIILAGSTGSILSRLNVSGNSNLALDQAIGPAPNGVTQTTKQPELGSISTEPPAPDPVPLPEAIPVPSQSNQFHRCIFPLGQERPCAYDCLDQPWPDTRYYCDPCRNNLTEMVCPVLY